MQPHTPQLVSPSSTPDAPLSLRRLAASSLIIALLLVAAVAVASTPSSSHSLVAHDEALPTHAQIKAAEGSGSKASPASTASHKRYAAYINLHITAPNSNIFLIE